MGALADVNADNVVDSDDALVLFYAHALREVLGDGHYSGSESARRLLLNELVGNLNNDDAGYRQLLRNANRFMP